MGEQNFSFLGSDVMTLAQMNRGKERKVFDWDKAAKLIKERKPETAEAGLQGDWTYTGGVIYRDGKPVLDTCCYLASTWATPMLELDGEEIECYVMESKTEWNETTIWPKSALSVLK